MAEEIDGLLGSTKASKPDAGQANLRSVPVYGVVKDNIDPTHSGRLRVYISDMGSNNPDDSNAWTPVYYASPFYGWVQPTAGEKGYGTYVSNPSSYGMWYSPPDIGSTVLCIFVNGDPTYGYWIACVPKIEALHMVPAIGASSYIITDNENEANGYGGATRLPVANMNTNDEDKTNSSKFLYEAKPIHSYVASILNQQGLIRDRLRGPISSSANRESPSRVGWGVSTPGRPIYQGGYTDQNILQNAESASPESLTVVSRQGGHSIVMDDGDAIGNDQLIRIRTAKGHQILMSDDGQTLFIIHSNGQTWVELGAEGTIDLYATNSVNVRTQGDLNLHADNNINIHAKKKLNIKAEDINLESEKSMNHKVGTDHSVDTMGTFTHKVGGPMSHQSGGPASFASGATTFINGSRINLNTGATSTVPKPVPVITELAHTDTLYDSTKGWVAAPGKLTSIASRAPAHAPWSNANQGVAVKTTGSANQVLPPAPSPSISAANKAAESAPSPSPVTVANAATVPPVNNPSKALDKSTTAAMVSAVAQNAATGAAAQAIAQGAGVISTAQGLVASVGKLAQTPSQLEAAGILKPGAGALVASLVSAGANVQASLTKNLFSGVSGAENLNSFVQNISAQVSGQATLFQKTQNALTSTGVMTGKEAPSAVAGLVMSGATSSIGGTIGVLQDLTRSYTMVAGVAQGVGQVANSLGLKGISGTIGTAIRSGSYAAGIAQSAVGGLASISNAVNVLNSVQGAGPAANAVASLGVAGAAFRAVLGTLSPFQTKVPQNLFAIAKAGATVTSALSNGIIAGAVGTNALTNLANAKTPVQAAGAATGALGAIAMAAVSAGTISRTITGNSKGLGNPGIAGALAAATNLAGSITGAASVLTGVAGPTGPNAGGPAATLRTVAQALGSASGAINAVKSIGTTGKNASIAGTLNSLSSAVNALTSTTRAIKNIPIGSPSVVASGISSLPGGQDAVAAVVTPTSSLPGTEAPAALAANSSTSALNGISLSQSLKSLTNGLDNAVSGVAGTFKNIEAATDPLKARLISLSGNIDSAVSRFEANPPPIVGQLNTTMSSFAGGMDSMVNNISGTLKNIEAATSPLKATLESLSGNIDSAVSKFEANPPPGVEQLKNTMASLTAGAAGTFGNISGSLLKSGDLVTNTLKEMAPGAAAKINSAMASLTSTGPNPIKLPSIGLDTFDRGELAVQTKALLGDLRIPVPNFKDPTSTDPSMVSFRGEIERLKIRSGIAKEQISLLLQQRSAIKDRDYLKNTLPAGSVEIDAAEQTIRDLAEKIRKKEEELEALNPK